MKRIFRQVQKHSLSLLFPEGFVCPVCGREAVLSEHGLCEVCAAQVFRCGVLSPPAPLDGLFANYRYDPILHPPMHRFKYGGEPWLARFFMQDTALPTDIRLDAMVPVPMHPLKEYLRTYNPPEALALALHEQIPTLPIRTDLLRKVRLTPSQTTMTREQRSTNVKDAFRASRTAHGMTILLIDDVTTTGSTLIACAKALKTAGAAQIFGLCACKASHGDGRPDDENKTED